MTKKEQKLWNEVVAEWERDKGREPETISERLEVYQLYKLREFLRDD